MTPKVSVVIPCYNYGRFVAQAIRSALAQTFTDREIIVVDDGSTDDTAAVVGSFAGAVRYVYQANRGLSAARNAGIRAARGEYIGFLDADDLWLSHKLSVQVPILDTFPAVGLVYGDSICFDHSTGRDVRRHRDHFTHLSGRVLGPLLATNFIASPTPLVRRRVFDEFGAFDERLRSAEDWDMWIRLATRWEIRYIDDALARYRLHGSNMSGNLLRMRDSQLTVLAQAFANPAIAAVRPDRRALRRRVLVDCGIGHFAVGAYDTARRNLASAVATDPRALLDLRVVTRLAFALLGQRAATAVRGVKRAVLPGRVQAAA